MTLLSVEDLRVDFGGFAAVSGVSFTIARGEALGIVGESGSGKTLTALSLFGLVPAPGRASGRVIFEGEDLVGASEARLRAARGDRLAMIFQDPLTALNPYLRVGEQLAEVLTVHRHTPKKEAWRRAVEALARVGIPAAEARAGDYPHQLSGGMRQRALIAMALLCEPALLVADEPTTALDVTVQAQILEIFRAEREARGAALLLITHDLGVLAAVADRVLVMYAGRVVEEGSVEAIYRDPRHPYTLGLARATPRLGGAPLVAIPGAPPAPGEVPAGCAFHPRCAHAIAACRERAPEARLISPGHLVRCHVEEIRR